MKALLNQLFFMDKNEHILQEQDAPLKNTDDAFVQVSKDGSPAIPQTNSGDDDGPKESPTTLDKR